MGCTSSVAANKSKTTPHIWISDTRWQEKGSTPADVTKTSAFIWDVPVRFVTPTASAPLAELRTSGSSISYDYSNIRHITNSTPQTDANDSSPHSNSTPQTDASDSSPHSSSTPQTDASDFFPDEYPSPSNNNRELQCGSTCIDSTAFVGVGPPYTFNPAQFHGLQWGPRHTGMEVFQHVFGEDLSSDSDTTANSNCTTETCKSCHVV